MIAILKFDDVFKDIYLEEISGPKEYLNDKVCKDVQNAVKNYDNEKIKSLASETFDTWASLMDVLNNDRKRITGCFFLKEIK